LVYVAQALRLLISGIGSEAGSQVGRNSFVGVLLVEAAGILAARRGAALLSSSSESSMATGGEGVLFEAVHQKKAHEDALGQTTIHPTD
jgi:hypothetical protein